MVRRRSFEQAAQDGTAIGAATVRWGEEIRASGTSSMACRRRRPARARPRMPSLPTVIQRCAGRPSHPARRASHQTIRRRPLDPGANNSLCTPETPRLVVVSDEARPTHG